MGEPHRYGWVIGFMDEVWWARFALLGLHLWAERKTGRLVQQTSTPMDPESKALACYELWWVEQEQMLLRFVTGRPVSHVTTAFLEWASAEWAAQGQRGLVLIWDNASWHVSTEVRRWIREHNVRAKRTGQGMRILVVGLPPKSPWLNKIEVKWKHGKSAIVELDGILTAEEVEARVSAYVGAAWQPRVVQQPPTSKRRPKRRRPWRGRGKVPWWCSARLRRRKPNRSLELAFATSRVLERMPEGVRTEGDLAYIGSRGLAGRQAGSDATQETPGQGATSRRQSLQQSVRESVDHRGTHD